MTQKELLESVLSELSSIKQGMPNGELKLMVEDMKELKEDVSELKYMLMNPEDGVIVKTNQNTYFRKNVEAKILEGEQHIRNLEEVLRWKSSVNKALWIIFGLMIAVLGKVFLNLPV